MSSFYKTWNKVLERKSQFRYSTWLQRAKKKTYLGGSTHNKCLLNDSIITWGKKQ